MHDRHTRPHLQDYLNRVGAKEKNFRHYVILSDEYDHYMKCQKVAADIWIDDENVISCAVKEHAPTEDEIELIKAEVARDPFPKSISATSIEKLLKKLGLKNNDESLFDFPDQKRKGVIFVQQRVINKQGDKQDLAWSYWSDGEWRPMEPNGESLPFWKPPKDRQKSRVMIHEGAKAARDIDDLVNNPARCQELAAHPWKDDLVDHEHWGWPGGATNPLRVDWSSDQLRQLTVITVVCDNDAPGKAAAKAISRQLARPVNFLMFADRRFKEGFDLADEFPKKMFATVKGKLVYRGPSFNDCLVSGTWATENVTVINPEGKVKHIYVLRAAFIAEWKFTNEPAMFYSIKRGSLFTTDTFNRSVRPFSDVPDTAALLIARPEAQLSGVTYNPGLAPGEVTTEAGSQINIYRPPTIKAVDGDIKPFLDFMTILLPIEKERNEMCRIVATLVARPDIRLPFGVLLKSETQGVGKSTLMEKILALLVGLFNTSSPSESDIADPPRPDWEGSGICATAVYENVPRCSARMFNDDIFWWSPQDTVLNFSRP